MYSPYTLTQWYNSPVPEHADRVLRYFARRSTMVLEILDAAEIVTKTACVKVIPLVSSFC